MHWLVWRYNIFCGELAALEYFSFITLYERAIISPFEIITIVLWSAEQCVLFGTSYNVALFLHCLHTDSSIAVIIAKCTQCIGAFSSCIFKVEMQGNHLQYTAFQKGNVLAFVYMSCLDGEHWLMCGSGRRPSSSPIQTSLRLHALHYVFWLLPLYFFCLSLKLAALCHSLMFRTSLVILSSYSQFSALGFSFFSFPPLLLPLKSLMPVTILLFTLSHPLPFSSDWLLRCSSRVTGLCGPWSSLALTACYLHGDGWLRRFCALFLTTAVDRAHTWDTSPTLFHPFALSFCGFLFFFFLSTFAFCPSVFCGSSWESCCGATW